MVQYIKCIIKQLGMNNYFAGKLNNWYQWYLTREGVKHYAINFLLYITMMREKCVQMYGKFIGQLNVC